jgi:hypothetical protein
MPVFGLFIEMRALGRNLGPGDERDLRICQYPRADNPPVLAPEPFVFLSRQDKPAIMAVLGNRQRFRQRTVGQPPIMLDEIRRGDPRRLSPSIYMSLV